MGTNFYIKGHRYTDDPKYHIGKRSAAGLYCWDCGITLCKDGENGVHTGRSEWYDKCPICGKDRKEESFENSSAGRELGFNKSSSSKKTGVQSCSSFTWARPLGRIRHIQDEYGREYSREEFVSVLKECPIQFMSHGSWFS